MKDILFSILLVTTFNTFCEEIKTYPSDLINKIEYGTKSNNLGEGLMPSGPHCFYPFSNKIFVCDSWNDRIIIYDKNLIFLEMIKPDANKINILNVNKMMVDEFNIFLLDSDGYIFCIDYNGNLIYKAFIGRIPFYLIDNIIYFYKDERKHVLSSITKDGEIIVEKETKVILYRISQVYSGTLLEKLPNKNEIIQYLKENNLLYFNGRLLNIEFYNHKKYYELLNEDLSFYNNMDIISLLGFDAHDNSYWYCSTHIGSIRYIVVLSKKGLKIDTFKIGSSDIIVLNNGDVIEMIMENDGVSFYRIKNTWDPIDTFSKPDTSSKTTVAFAAKAASLTATSFIDYQSMYIPYRVFDGDPKTAWLEAAKGSGIDEAITLTLDKEITVDEIRFMPGYFDKQWWNANNRIRKLTAESAGKVFTFTFDDAMYEQGLKLSAPITFTKIKFSIKEVYRSTGDDDTALSEISFYNAGKKVEIDTSGVK